jgi:transcriptional regulator with XRE-family HTH domain
MITSAQLRAARALLGVDQRELAVMSGLSLPTVQRMEASGGVIRGNVDSLMKLVSALDAAGIELIAEEAFSSGGGRGVRLKSAQSLPDAEKSKAGTHHGTQEDPHNQ